MRGYHAVAVHYKFAPAAQREPIHCRDRRDHRIPEVLRCLLELGHHRFHFRQLSRHQGVGKMQTARGFEHGGLGRFPELSGQHAEGRWRLAAFKALGGFLKLAPAENGGSVCQITSARQLRSASSTACCTPSSTSLPIVCILLLKLRIAIPSSLIPSRRVARGMPHPHRVRLKYGYAVLRGSLSNRSGNSWRR